MQTIVRGARRGLGLGLLALVAAPLATADGPVFVEGQRLVVSDPRGSDLFGSSVALDGDTLAVGMPCDDDQGAQSGSVHVYVRTTSGWTLQAELHSSASGWESYFGHALALQGDTLAVGATGSHDPSLDAQRVSVFVRRGATWTEVDAFTTPSAMEGTGFGHALALDGNTLLVGAPNEDGPYPLDRRGAAYVYERAERTWQRTARLMPPELDANDYFGSSVALAGDIAVVGARQASDAGAAWVFARTGTSWTQVQRLDPPDPEAREFGWAVALDGSTLVVGSRSETTSRIGSAYVYTSVGGSWTLAEHLAPPDAIADGWFGSSIAVRGDWLLVGAPNLYYLPEDPGAGYLFRRDAGAWGFHRKLMTADGGPEDSTGGSVALGADVAVLGVPGDGYAGLFHAGSVATFRRVDGDPGGAALCFGDGSGAPCPCGNDSPTAGEGCVHSGGVGMTIGAAGSASVAADDLALVVAGCPVGNAGIFFGGNAAVAAVALFDGLQCVGGDVRRFRARFQSTGVVSDGGIGAQDPTGTWLLPGSAYTFQYWTRDVAAGTSPCGFFANLSPGYAVTMVP